MRRSVFAAVAAAALFSGACTDQTPIPTAPPAIPGPSFSHLTPTASQIKDQITKLFTNAAQRASALYQFGKIEDLMTPHPPTTAELKEARVRTFVLIAYTLDKFHKGQLAGGKSEATKVAMLGLFTSLLRYVDFEDVPDLSGLAPTAGTTDFVAQSVTSAGATLMPPSGDFAMKVPQDALPLGVTAFMIGAKIETPSTVGEGPLPPSPSYRQLPVMVSWTMFRSDGLDGFEKEVLVAACEVDEDGPDAKYHAAESNVDSDGTPFLPPEYGGDQTKRLALAHLVDGEVLIPPSATQAELAELGVTCDDTYARARTPDRSGGMLALGRRSLETVFGQIGRLISPKPAYAFTLLLGCKTKAPTGSTSPWAIIDQYPPVKTVTVTPASGTINVGQQVTLTATLTDAYGFPLEPGTGTGQRAVTWYLASTNGGAVTLTPSSSGGTVTVTGTAVGTVTVAARSEAIDGTATLTVRIGYPNFTNLDGLNLFGNGSYNGAAWIPTSTEGGALRLTPSGLGLTGAAWHAAKHHLASGFTTTFSFRVSDPDNCGPADGLAFVVRADGSATLGGSGGSMGYFGIAPSLAVEFDTWQNTEHGDPDNKHVSVKTQAGESAIQNLATYSLAAHLADGQPHAAKIQYLSGTPGTLKVFLDNMNDPIITTSVTPPSGLFDGAGRAYVGFTAATGCGSENHDVESWTLTAP